MNDRIKLLAEQAGMTDDKFGMYFAKDKHDEDGVDLEKFAELIVRECAQFVEDKFDFCGDEIIIAEQILKQFGVEE